MSGILKDYFPSSDRTRGISSVILPLHADPQTIRSWLRSQRCGAGPRGGADDQANARRPFPVPLLAAGHGGSAKIGLEMID